MRTPSPTFRDDLKAHQENLSAWGLKEDHWKGRLAHEIIARWIDNNECETIWTTVQPFMKIAGVTPDHFISNIIAARLDTEQLNIIVREAPALEAKVRARTKRHVQEKKYSQLAYENEILGRFVERRRQTLGREKTGPRIAFMKRLSGSFERWCGQPLDNIVRILTDIAFDGETTTEAVRAARSSRAKLNRGTRRQK